MALPSPTNISSYTKMHLGGDNWDVVYTASNFGQPYVELSMDSVKRRVLAVWVSITDEPTLDPRVLNYLGICTALDLISAARSAWANRIISKSLGHDPQEIEVYTDRSRRLDELVKDLLRKLPAIQAAAIPILEQPIVGLGSRPAIDEFDDYTVTEDPRLFPPASTFPYPRCLYDG